jgi:hypothetical protein
LGRRGLGRRGKRHGHIARQAQSPIGHVSKKEGFMMQQNQIANQIANQGDMLAHKRQKRQQHQEAWEFKAMITHWDDFCFVCYGTGHMQARCE